MNRFVTIGSMLTLSAAFAACDTAEPPAAVSIDVAKAEAARSANVADERLDGAKEVARRQQAVAAQRRNVLEAAANWNHEVALTQAEGDFKVAKRACEALSVSARTNCTDRAALVFESDKSRAELLKPGV